ncbi:hypothetical protein EVAR_2853_1 [Eumeta japonica]|uniref:Uncharacterized protein n=1 Tax=Eumeta variegata TaxID=151549 RepID=A0A4C1T0I2_EUMVA|nr:hypothetical protein EVAR_2853_1 [Eumeta japonica]
MAIESRHCTHETYATYEKPHSRHDRLTFGRWWRTPLSRASAVSTRPIKFDEHEHRLWHESEIVYGKCTVAIDVFSEWTKARSASTLATAHGDKTSRKTTIINWLADLKRSRVNLSNEFRDGRLSTAVNNKNIDAVHRIIQINSMCPTTTFGHL